MSVHVPRPLVLVLAALLALAVLGSPAAAQSFDDSSAMITATFDADCLGFDAASDKDISHIIVRFEGGSSMKIEPISDPTYAYPGDARTITSITVKSATSSADFFCPTSGTGTGGTGTGGTGTGGTGTGGTGTGGTGTGGTGTGGTGTGGTGTGGTGTGGTGTGGTGTGGTGTGGTGTGATGTGGTGTNGGSGTSGEEPVVTPAAEIVPERIGGQDRIETAILISQGLFADGEANAVVLARQDIPADAIAATPFSVTVDAPVLLSTPDVLDPRVATEIQRVLADGGTVYLMGLTAALSADVESAVAALGFPTDRIGGENRFGTATQIADRLFGLGGQEATYGPGAGNTVMLADGGGFTSALVAGPAATSVAGAVLLTSGADMAVETAAWLAANDGYDLVAVGDLAQQAAPAAQAVGGADAHVTATEVAEAFFSAPTIAGLATSAAFPDGLTGGVDIAHRGGPLLLSPQDALPATVQQWVQGNMASLLELRIYGGTAAISPAVADQLQAATVAE